MELIRVLPEDIFVWKSLPVRYQHRVTRLPEEVEQRMAVKSGFPLRDQMRAEELAAQTDLSGYPEQRLSPCQVMNVVGYHTHRRGRMEAIEMAALLKVDARDLGRAVKMLTGLEFGEWTGRYLWLMHGYLVGHTNLQPGERASVLGFSSVSAYSHFLKRGSFDPRAPQAKRPGR